MHTMTFIMLRSVLLHSVHSRPCICSSASVVHQPLAAVSHGSALHVHAIQGCFLVLCNNAREPRLNSCIVERRCSTQASSALKAVSNETGGCRDMREAGTGV
jgi:hypothetical protein